MVNRSCNNAPMATLDQLGLQSINPASSEPQRWIIVQTNPALYRQLHDLGCASESLAEIRAAYELAAALFAGCVRPCGRPFLPHLIGTASVLAELGARVAVVAAGLLHATYEQDDFGSLRWRNRRTRVHGAVGAAVEHLILRYDALKWNSSTIPQMSDRLDVLEKPDRSVLLMRLANEVDDHADFAREPAVEARHDDRVLGPVIVEMGTRPRKPRFRRSARTLVP